MTAPGFIVRPLPHAELRKDPLVDRWVIISTERAGRPIETPTAKMPSQIEYCPFCEGREAETPDELFALRDPLTPIDGPGWRVRVVPNRYPAVRMREVPTMTHANCQPGIGSHEVFVECPHHERNIAYFSIDGIAEVLESYQQRLAFWRADGRLRYGQLFKNVGPSAGASLEHSHAQLIVLPLVPRDVQAELDAVHRHHHETGRCLLCDLMQQERRSGRFILESSAFTVFAPFASRFSFESWIFPNRHHVHFDEMTSEERLDFAEVLRTMLRRLDLLGQPDFNLVLHTAPFDHVDERDFHWHMEILPRMTQAAGFEWGTGFAINPIPPEQAAEFFRHSS